jgi:AbrB family transcriptional regulator (stage V sporulation protein T)
VAVCDKDCVIACAGISKKEFAERKHSDDMEKIIEARTLYNAPASPERRIYLTDENKNYYVSCAMPIFTEGDVIGCVASIGSTEGKYELPPTETEIKLIQTAASFLGKQMES